MVALLFQMAVKREQESRSVLEHMSVQESKFVLERIL